MLDTDIGDFNDDMAMESVLCFAHRMGRGKKPREKQFEQGEPEEDNRAYM